MTTASKSILIQGAEVLAMTRPDGERPVRADVLLQDGKIAAIGTGLAVPASCEVIAGHGKLLMPGLVNAHTHSSETFFKGRYEQMPLETWLLYAYTYISGAPIPDRLLYLRTLLLAMQSLKNGVTTLCDDFFDPMAHSTERLGIVFQAYRDAGIRVNVSSAVLDTPVLDSTPFGHEIFPEHLRNQLTFGAPTTVADYTAYCQEAFRQFHGQADGRLRFAITPSAPQRCTTGMLQACHALAVEHGVPLHTHLLETKVQAVAGQMFYGKTLLAHMHDIGVLDRHTTLAHAIWITDDDIARMGEAGCSVVHNPLSNLKLGSGLAPIRKLLDAGVAIGLGTDGLSSNDSARVFDLVRFATLMHNTGGTPPAQWLSAIETLRMATIDGARTAMLDGVTGSLEVGKAADLVMLDLDNDNFRPRNDIVRQLAYCENGSSIELVVVAGHVVCRNGQLATVRENDVWGELNQLLPAYLEEHGRWEIANRVFEPCFSEVIRRCKATDIGLQR
ncbi:amidohydrolase [Variovorax sp. KBW07]|uniref:amidohydrolase family protein n=1 Tax=Variovorax sp. KBW07 TaxID=2153358 RepID=UPI000F573033|nr:amidohydrolase [Variovorax sp. KBW07]RQO49457.1 amidohydrolase [Variovorax sp. KBW07]